MGEDFRWVNPEKKEYLCPTDFDLGSRRYQTVYEDNELLCALRDLLSNEWKGNMVVWIGDQCDIPDGIAVELFNKINLDSEELGYNGDILGTICESYKNVSGLFKNAEKIVREEIGDYIQDYKEHTGFIYYNEYGIDINDPFKGLFRRTGKVFRYTLNHSKKSGYSMSDFKLFSNEGFLLSEHFDPLPILMGYGSTVTPGLWLGDIIGVGDTFPSDYKLMNELYVEW